MTVKELVKELKKYDQELEIRTIDLGIEEDSEHGLPTFPLLFVSSPKEEFEGVEAPEGLPEFVILGIDSSEVEENYVEDNPNFN